MQCIYIKTINSFKGYTLFLPEDNKEDAKQRNPLVLKH